MDPQNQFIQTNININLNEIDTKFLHEIDCLYEKCFINFLSGKTFRGNPNKILQTLNNIIINFNKNKSQKFEPDKIIPCSIKILFLCDEELYKSQKFFQSKCRQNYKLAKICYNNLLEIFIPNQMLKIVNIVIQIIHKEEFWQWESLCYELIYGLVNNGINQHNIVHYLLDEITDKYEITIHNVRLIMGILNITILKYYLWPNNNETEKLVIRFLKLFRNEIDESTISNSQNKLLKRSIQLCFRNMIKNLSHDHCNFIIYELCSWVLEENMNENIILEFSSVLEYTANLKNSDLLKIILTDELFILIMRMIQSKNALISLLGNRVLQFLIDRGKNRSQFESPQIFFKDIKYNININYYNDEDRLFLKRHRELFHDTFVSSLITHSSIRLNIECTYCTICLLAVEIPCGFTAAALICLILNIQDLILNTIDITHSNHLHSTVMAIMTLICWVHRADILYSYVYQVMMQRAQWAPHLNPPFKAHYSFSEHHVLWNKPEHFFIDWEVRFGLWKCFRLHVNSDLIHDNSKNN